MIISQAYIHNFRLLQNTEFNLKDNISWIIGRNNTGKTSLIKIFDNFINNKNFSYYDFSISVRNKLDNINKDTEIDDLSIKLILKIKYDEKDDLLNLSEFMLDLDPAERTVNLLFEAIINKDKLLQSLLQYEEKDKKKNFIKKEVSKFLDINLYTFENKSPTINKIIPYIKEHKKNFTKKEIKLIKNIINLQIIHAKRDVISSEDYKSKEPLSNITTNYFNNKHDEMGGTFDEFNKLALDTDSALSGIYQKEETLNKFVENAKDTLGIDDVSIISDIESKMLVNNRARIIYGKGENFLPETYNGLGHINILYLLLDIQIKKELFQKQNSSINLLFIEEPEAHTHPQLQYSFANNIQKFINEKGSDIKIQSLISTHSPHLISQSNFEQLRYLKKTDNNIQILDINSNLKENYKTDLASFQFIKQYLDINSYELFFAEKVIFIEGDTEKILLPYFIKKISPKLMSQNVTNIEAGANAKVFSHLLNILGIKSLIITDIDTTKIFTKRYQSCPVVDGTNTSNQTLKHFLSAPKLNSEEFPKWLEKLKSNSLLSRYSNIKVTYQTFENDYHARSFEDSFFVINYDKLIEEYKNKTIKGLNNWDYEEDHNNQFTDLVNMVIDKKSTFASSILFTALTKGIDWNIPKYIKEGLLWLQQD